MAKQYNKLTDKLLVKCAMYICNKDATIEKAANTFNVSCSSLQSRLRNDLKFINYNLYTILYVNEFGVNGRTDCIGLFERHLNKKSF